MVTAVHLGLSWLLVCLTAATIEAAFVCPNPDLSPAGLHPDPANCSCYYQCANNIAYHQMCPDNLHFNPTLLVCDWPYEAGCAVQPTTTPSAPPSTTTAPAAFVCPNPDLSPAGLHPDPANCSCYYQCANNIAYHQMCPDNLHFNPTLLVCDWPYEAGCVEPTLPSTAPSTPGFTTFSPTQTTPDNTNNERFACNGFPCLHGGDCTDSVNAYGYNCNCRDTGYEGRQCQTSDKPGCDPTLCKSPNGYCAEGEAGEGDICQCHAGYSGTNCLTGEQTTTQASTASTTTQASTASTTTQASTASTTTQASTASTTTQASTASTAAASTLAQRPNFIVFVVDDLGSSDVSWHVDAPEGSPDINSTELEDFVNEYGVFLDNNNVQPVCTASRHSLLFGRHEAQDSLQHYVIRSGQRHGSPASLDSLAEELREEEYKSYMIGKWHLGNFDTSVMPVNQGFDKFYGYVHGESDHYTRVGHEPLFCYPNGEFLEELEEFRGYDFINGTVPQTTNDKEYSTDLFERLFKQVFDDHMRSHSSQPFFIDVSLNAAHTPLQAIEYEDPTDPSQFRRNYAAMVNYLDKAVRRMIQHVQDHDSNVWNNTIVVFTSDNGGDPTKGASNYPLRGGKFTLFEGGLKGAGFVASPYLRAQNVQGQHINDFIHISDWYPTFVHLAGGSIEEGQDLSGQIVWHDVNEMLHSERTTMLLTMDSLTQCKGSNGTGLGIFDTRQRAGVRLNNWKLLTGNPVYPAQDGFYHNQQKIEQDDDLDTNVNLFLFDLDEDPTESTNLAFEPEYEAQVEIMLQLLADYQSDFVAPVFFPPMDLLANPDSEDNPYYDFSNGGAAEKPFFSWASLGSGEFCRPDAFPPAVCGAAIYPLDIPNGASGD